MEILQWCKTQIACMVILMFIGALYVRDGNRINKKANQNFCNKDFDAMFIIGLLTIFFDGFTACSVNYIAEVPRWINNASHFMLYFGYETFVVLMMFYAIEMVRGEALTPQERVVYRVPYLIGVLGTICFLPMLRFDEGEYTNYSMGIPVYFCFITVAFYGVHTIALIVVRNKNITKQIKMCFTTVIFSMVIIIILQFAFPECLLASLALSMVLVCIYMGIENPNLKDLKRYQGEMVMGFATLVENKDGSTGGHIKRTSEYAIIIAKQLKQKPEYKNYINKDYLAHLAQAAPMHDIGKIGIPDSILQKPGKLTDEEFQKMKEHPVIGGKIIKNTFGHLYDDAYENMAYEVAMYHHEKWNGKGYPQGLSETDIPLCARIMAVADVFDAVSAKRCYRDALPLEECFRIIKDGSGEDFDPVIVHAFMTKRKEVEAIYYNMAEF